LVGQRLELVGVDLGVALALGPRQIRVARDAEQPGTDRRLTAKQQQAGGGAYKRFLRQLLGQQRIAAHAKQIACHRRPVVGVQLLERARGRVPEHGLSVCLVRHSFSLAS